MNSRFGHLEFESHENPPDEQEFNEPTLGQDQMAEAIHAFEHEEFANALQRYARILEFESENKESWIGQVQSLLQLNRTEEALNWANRAVELFPSNPDLQALTSIALARNGNIAEALAYSDSASRASTKSVIPWLSRAEILAIQGDSTADYCEARAWAISPEKWQIAWLCSRMRTRHKQNAKALKWALSAVEQAPTHPTPWVLTARCQAALALTSQAQESIERAHQLTPNSSRVCKLMKELEKPKGLGDILKGLRFRSRSA